METVKLSDRLQMIADFVNFGAKAADLGTDHGYIPVYLSMTGRCKHVIASDVSEAPLQKAISTAANYGVQGIEFRLTDGLVGFSPSDVDTIIIAGMGGDNIAEILSAAPWAWDCDLILQPMSKRERLTMWLRSNGLYIVQEKLARDKGRIYSVLKVCKGSDGDNSPAGLYVSHALANSGDALLEDYINSLIKKAEKARIGLEESTAPDVFMQIGRLLQIIMGLDKIREELK